MLQLSTYVRSCELSGGTLTRLLSQVSVIRNTEKDPKTSKVQAKDGWANAMKGLVELQKDYTERLKGKKDEDYSAEQTAFFECVHISLSFISLLELTHIKLQRG